MATLGTANTPYGAAAANVSCGAVLANASCVAATAKTACGPAPGRSPFRHGAGPSVVVVALALLAVSASPLRAQTLRGWVLRADRTPIPDATVTVIDEDGSVRARTVAGEDGRFRISVPAGERLRLGAEHLGFETWETAPFTLEPDAELEIVIQMQVAPIPLDALEVEARRRRTTQRLADFRRRSEIRAFGGYFMVEEDIARRPAARPSFLPLQFPGMTVAPMAGPFDRWIVMTGDCVATVFVDGVRIDQGNVSVDDYLELDRIAGVEVYPRGMTVPPQYQDALRRDCGTVLYWTKDLEPDDPGGWTTTKIALGVVSFTGLLILLAR